MGMLAINKTERFESTEEIRVMCASIIEIEKNKYF